MRIGDTLWKDLEADFQKVFTVRKELAEVAAFRSDPEQLRKFKNLFLEVYQIMSLFNKYFTYGNQKVCAIFLTLYQCLGRTK